MGAGVCAAGVASVLGVAVLTGAGGAASLGLAVLVVLGATGAGVVLDGFAGLGVAGVGAKDGAGIEGSLESEVPPYGN